MVHKILKLDKDKWAKFEFIHLLHRLIFIIPNFIGVSGVANLICKIKYNISYRIYIRYLVSYLRHFLY